MAVVCRLSGKHSPVVWRELWAAILVSTPPFVGSAAAMSSPSALQKGV